MISKDLKGGKGKWAWGFCGKEKEPVLRSLMQGRGKKTHHEAMGDGLHRGNKRVAFPSAIEFREKKGKE